MNNDSKRWYRKWNLDITADEVQKIVETTTPEESRTNQLRGPYTPPDSDALTGCFLQFTGEGHRLEWNMLEKNLLQLTEDGLTYEPVFCQVLTNNGVTFLVHHLIPEAMPLRCVDLIIDMATGNATAVLAQLGTEHSARDVSREFLFGRISGDFPEEGPLHGFTSDMVGRAIVWTYHDGEYEVRHVYSTNYYYTYTMQVPEGCWVASNPADYVKINDHTYIFSFVEERQPGVQGLFLMDLEKLHDVGACFGVDAREKLISACFGAVGKEMPMYQVFK